MLEGFTKIPNFPFEAYENLDTDLLTLGIYVHLLRKAAIRPTCAKINGAVVTLDRGQLVTGRRKLASKFKVTEKRIRTSLELLKGIGAIDIKGASLYSIITVCYDKSGPTEGQQEAHERPTQGQQKANTGPTEGQLGANAGPQRNIEYSREKIEESYTGATAPASGSPLSEASPSSPSSQKKQRKSQTFVPPTLEECQCYCMEIDAVQYFSGEKFWRYFDSMGWKDANGKPVKNWKLKMQTWKANNAAKGSTAVSSASDEHAGEKKWSDDMYEGEGYWRFGNIKTAKPGYDPKTFKKLEPSADTEGSNGEQPGIF